MANEELLIKQLQEGSEQALSVLYDRYSGALYGVIIRICNNEAIAKDILQEVFVKIWQKSSSYHSDKGRFYTWAYRIAKNHTLNSIRNTSNLIQNEDLSVYTNIETTDGEPLDTLKLKGVISKLEKHHQKAIALVYFQGLTHREAHQEMDVPLGTFKSYIQQALKKMREFYDVLVIGWFLIAWL